MREKKGGDLLIVGGDLLTQWEQLTHKRLHEAGLCPRGDGIGGKLRLLQQVPNVVSHFGRSGMMGRFEHSGHFLNGGRQSSLGSSIGLQKDQR